MKSRANSTSLVFAPFQLGVVDSFVIAVLSSTLSPVDESERDTRRSTLHVTELKYVDGNLTCDRNEPVYINLGPFRK